MDNPDSQARSSSGEGRRLGGSSRNGSSSALTGAGAAHQAGVGGSQTAGTQAKNGGRDGESQPDFSQAANRLEGMLFGDDDDDDFGGGVSTSHHNYHNPLHSVNEPSWSFGPVMEAHGPSQMTTTATGPSFADSDDESVDDAASDQAVGGDDMSDTEMPVGSLLDEPIGDEGVALPKTPGHNEQETLPIQDVPPPLEADDDDDLQVVELQVPEEDRVVSD